MKRSSPARHHGQRASQPVDTYFSQITARYGAGEYQEALEACRKLLRIAPKHAGAQLYAGVICYLTGELSASEKYLKSAASLGNPDAYTNLGMTLSALHRPADAEAAYRRAVAQNPRQERAWNNLGNILKNSFRAERREEAIACYRAAIRANPTYATAYNNLGHALESVTGDLPQAEKHFRQALACDASYIQASLNLADILERTGRPEEALQELRSALARRPGNLQLISRTLDLRRSLADWDEAQEPSMTTLLAALGDTASDEIQPLNLLAWPEIDAMTQRRLAGRFGRQRWAASLAAPPLVGPTASPREGRLRVGYLSADFRNHPVAHLITEVIQAHDRERFQVFLYAYGPVVDDPERRRLQHAADAFKVISAIDDMEAATLIRDDGVDLLIDLTGYTTHARPGICALRPAPTIVSWIGYIGTLGEPRLADYIIGDAIATPAENAPYFSETLALMPECYQPNCSLSTLAAPPPRSQEGLPDNSVVFCSFNQVFKLTPQLWDDWCEILRGVPGSVLWIAPGSEVIRRNLVRETEKRGIAAERIVFAARKSLAEHHARLALADIALDTFPYNSGATASDALRAGVPLVTRMGDTFVSRMAGSLLHALGMEELCTDNRCDYIRLAIELARDEARRVTLRSKLEQRLQSSILFQPTRFTAQLEQLYCAMHEQALSGRREIIDLWSKRTDQR